MRHAQDNLRDATAPRVHGRMPSGVAGGSGTGRGVSTPMTGRLLLIFTPILALAGIAAILAITAWIQAGSRAELLIRRGCRRWRPGWSPWSCSIGRSGSGRRRSGGARLEAQVSDIVESAMDPIITVDDQPARRRVQRGGREGVSLAAQRGAGAAARRCSSRSSFARVIARTSSASARPGHDARAWARRPCSWRCAPTASNSRSKRRSRSIQRTTGSSSR